MSNTVRLTMQDRAVVITALMAYVAMLERSLDTMPPTAEYVSILRQELVHARHARIRVGKLPVEGDS